MRGFRLNGWQRVGIVASVAWAIGAWIYTTHSFERQAGANSKESIESCVNREMDRGALTGDCVDLAMEGRRLDLLNKNETAAFNALVPIPIAWLLVYGLLGLVRWIRRGFQPAS